MKYKFEDKLYPCQTSLTMRFIGGKWKSVILIHLVNKTKRYHELRKKIPTITERTLSIQLKQLEKDGLINRKVYSRKPPLKVEYSLTSYGETLIPLLEAISDWANKTAKLNKKIQTLA